MLVERFQRKPVAELVVVVVVAAAAGVVVGSCCRIGRRVKDRKESVVEGDVGEPEEGVGREAEEVLHHLHHDAFRREGRLKVFF